MEYAVIPALIGAILGLVIGYLAGRRMAPGSDKQRELERQLEAMKEERAHFEKQVNSHFAETAGRLNTLTENYRSVYAHLASGAAALCSEDASPCFEALAAPAATAGDDGKETIDAASVVIEPPRDYATRGSAGDPGVLDERYGMDSDDVPPDHSKDDKG